MRGPKPGKVYFQELWNRQIVFTQTTLRGFRTRRPRLPWISDLARGLRAREKELS